jgi:hypothetical protein
MNFAAVRLDVLNQLFEVVIEVVDGVLFHLARAHSQSFPVIDAGQGFAPPVDEGVSSALERTLENRVLQSDMRTFDQIWIS